MEATGFSRLGPDTWAAFLLLRSMAKQSQRMPRFKEGDADFTPRWKKCQRMPGHCFGTTDAGCPGDRT